MRDEISNNTEPLKEALILSIKGNLIDYGAKRRMKEEDILLSLNRDVPPEIDRDFMTLFQRDLHRAKEILFIGDNAGEIVFDMLLLEQMPLERTVYVVRGYSIINDSTIEDALYIGLDKIVQVIDTEDNTPGIDFKRSSEIFLDKFKQADMIILKGQGNFETVFDEPIELYKKQNTPLYFFLKVKCDHVARTLNCKLGDSKFLRVQ